MPTKAEQYAQMAEKVAVQLTGSWQEWAGFLTTAARLYKYPFHEQLMIYAQRPDATACAEYDLWNNRMGRYVRRGSKGIALVDDSGDRLRLRYVFDISDTGTREHSRTPWLWTLEESHTAPVAAMLYVLANTVQQKEWDGRFSRANKEWAGTVEVPPNPDSFGGERNREFVVDSHPGLTDLFLTLAKREYLLTQPLTPEDIQAEAGRLLRELQAQDAPNSPNGTHYMAQFSEDFMRRANSKDMDQVMAALPFRSMVFSGLNDRKGHFVLIPKDEDRSKELRQRRPSVRRQLKQEPRSAGKKAEKKAPTRKTKEPER